MISAGQIGSGFMYYGLTRWLLLSPEQRTGHYHDLQSVHKDDDDDSRIEDT